MHVPQKLRKELKRKGTKALAFFLAFVLAVQCMNLPVIVAAATDAAGNAPATVEDTPSNDQATSAATDQAADQAATETEQPATEQAPVEQPAEPAEPAEPATEEPAATEAPAADQPAESATPAGSENVTAGGASENGQAPVAPAADTTATVALSLAQSTLTVGADTYTATDTTMEAPANQELKFSVAPEGGFVVKTVKQIAADRTETELSADASGIYTIAPEAVADGLEIKVETEEAPAAEEQPAEEAPAEEPATDESTDETTEPTEDEAATEEPATEEPAEDETTTDEQTPADEATEDEAAEDAAPEDKTTATVENALESVSNDIAMLAAGDETGTVTVTVKKTDDPKYSKTVNMPLGAISQETIKSITDGLDGLKGYGYRDVRVDDYAINSIKQVAGITYVMVSDDQIAGIQVENTEDIVIWFEPYVETYDVNYTVKLDGKTIDPENAPGELTVPRTVRQGDSLSIGFTPSDNWHYIDSVTNNGQEAQEQNGLYVFSNIQSDPNIVINLKSDNSSRYGLIFAGSSNTKLTYGDRTYKSEQSNGAPTYKLSYTICESLTFKLQAYNDWSSASKMLNKLTLTIDGNEYAINVPARQGNSATTPLPDGTQVVVENTDNKTLLQAWSVHYPSYNVTITAPEGQKLSGDIRVVTNCKDRGDKEIWVTQLTGVGPLGTSNVELISDDGDEKLSAGSGEYGKFNSSTVTFYIKVQKGFNDTTAPAVTVVIDGESKSYTAVKTNKNGYDYEFTINKNSGDDFRIIVEAQPLERAYGVKYLSDGDVVKKQRLEFGSNFNVGRDVEVSKDSYVLDGWKLAGDDSTLYRGDATFAVNDSTKAYANYDAEDGVWYFEFEAQWTSESDAKEAPYQLEVYIDEGEGYGEQPVYSVTEYGVLGYSAVVDEDSLIERLTGREGIPDDLAELYELDTDNSNLSQEIEADGSSVVKVCFKRAEGTIAFEENGGTKVEDITGPVGKAIEGNLPTTTKDGYKFLGWYSTSDFQDDTEVTKLPEKFTKGTITYYAKWEQKEGRVGYNLVLPGATWASGDAGQFDSNGTSEQGGPKYLEKDGRYAYPDTFTVTSAVPQCDGYVFIGWFDKARTTTDNGSSNPAIREAGSEVKFLYDDDNAYTLDALWASIDAKG